MDTRRLEDIFPDEEIAVINIEREIKPWQMYFDGAANQKGCGAGILLITPEGVYKPMATRLEFKCTNNMAEYEACVIGLEAALSIGVKNLQVYGDSSIVVCQVRGDWKTRDEKLKPYQGYIEVLMKQFAEISFNYIQRENNRYVDALVTLTSMINFGPKEKIQPFMVDLRSQPSYQNCINTLTPDGRPWFAPIIDFI
ncbi:uncharacterized protein LOC122653013 [Telopea speciosissima]|uniref:uncharacterized protein LOC122653013 n=1 Tax=Telopea speciosissima TaxID=54955 RepID=UPI001CC525BD|nr:uncharacterized protein LOC122653013 [Telopea speciosissima]